MDQSKGEPTAAAPEAYSDQVIRNTAANYALQLAPYATEDPIDVARQFYLFLKKIDPVIDLPQLSSVDAGKVVFISSRRGVVDG